MINLDIKPKLTIANLQKFLNFNDIKKLSESFEQIDSKYWTNWQGVLNKLAESFEISENRIFCQILLEIGSFLHQNFTNCSIFADSLYLPKEVKKVLQIKIHITLINNILFDGRVSINYQKVLQILSF